MRAVIQRVSSARVTIDGRTAGAIPLYEKFLAQTESALGRPVASGEFGAMMQVALVNDGPVTLVIDSRTRE